MILAFYTMIFFCVLLVVWFASCYLAANSRKYNEWMSIPFRKLMDKPLFDFNATDWGIIGTIAIILIGVYSVIFIANSVYYFVITNLVFYGIYKVIRGIRWCLLLLAEWLDD